MPEYLVLMKLNPGKIIDTLGDIRKLEERPKNKRMPIMSDIRDSGSLEQDADVIIFMNRDDYWYKDDKDYEPTNIADIKVAKNRNGETGMFGMYFYGGTQRFENL